MQTATIEQLAAASAPYALQINGDRLAPALQHGQYVAVQPGRTSKTGDLVVAAIREEKPAVMRQNADGDLLDNKGGYVPSGQWRTLGIVTGTLAVGSVYHA
ncbi:MAG: S24 family peptidase [Armatimonadota bacterium]